MEKLLGNFPEVPDHDPNIFSEYPVQNYYHGSTIFGSGNNGDMDIEEFLDSILASPDDNLCVESASHPISGVDDESPKYISVLSSISAKDGGSSSESDVDLVYDQVSII